MHIIFIIIIAVAGLLYIVWDDYPYSGENIQSPMPIRMVFGSNPEQVEYHIYHKKRLQLAFDLVRKYMRYDDGKVLEVAPWTLAYNFNTHTRIGCDTLGYADRLIPSLMHMQYDLFKIRDPFTWPHFNEFKYQMVIACEIIEHLPVPMDQVFTFLSHYVKPGGYLLIQTPNAVALKKRVAMAVGKNPFQLIQGVPGASHIREFTVDELIEIGKYNGLILSYKGIHNYFNYASTLAKSYELAGHFLPASMHDGITLIFKKPLY